MFVCLCPLTQNSLLSFFFFFPFSFSFSQKELDWDQKLFIASDIARGLHFLHEVRNKAHVSILADAGVYWVCRWCLSLAL